MDFVVHKIYSIDNYRILFYRPAVRRDVGLGCNMVARRDCSGDCNVVGSQGQKLWD